MLAPFLILSSFGCLGTRRNGALQLTQLLERSFAPLGQFDVRRASGRAAARSTTRPSAGGEGLLEPSVLASTSSPPTSASSSQPAARSLEPVDIEQCGDEEVTRALRPMRRGGDPEEAPLLLRRRTSTASSCCCGQSGHPTAAWRQCGGTGQGGGDGGNGSRRRWHRHRQRQPCRLPLRHCRRASHARLEREPRQAVLPFPTERGAEHLPVRLAAVRLSLPSRCSRIAAQRPDPASVASCRRPLSDRAARRPCARAAAARRSSSAQRPARSRPRPLARTWPRLLTKAPVQTSSNGGGGGCTTEPRGAVPPSRPLRHLRHRHHRRRWRSAECVFHETTGTPSPMVGGPSADGATAPATSASSAATTVAMTSHCQRRRLRMGRWRRRRLDVVVAAAAGGGGAAFAACLRHRPRRRRRRHPQGAPPPAPRSRPNWLNEQMGALVVPRLGRGARRRGTPLRAGPRHDRLSQPRRQLERALADDVGDEPGQGTEREPHSGELRAERRREQHKRAQQLAKRQRVAPVYRRVRQADCEERPQEARRVAVGQHPTPKVGGAAVSAAPLRVGRTCRRASLGRRLGRLGCRDSVRVISPTIALRAAVDWQSKAPSGQQPPPEPAQPSPSAAAASPSASVPPVPSDPSPPSPPSPPHRLRRRLHHVLAALRIGSGRVSPRPARAASIARLEGSAGSQPRWLLPSRQRAARGGRRKSQQMREEAAPRVAARQQPRGARRQERPRVAQLGGWRREMQERTWRDGRLLRRCRRDKLRRRRAGKGGSGQVTRKPM